jgi:hypothetical protein
MSWNVSFIGKPEKVVEALKAYSEKLSGQSKVEFDSVCPGLITLAEQNFGGPNDVLVNVTAAGHGTASADGTQIERYCTAKLERVYGLLV